MDCFNHDCPFRENKTSSCNRCDCIVCPNRRSYESFLYNTNYTLTDEELAALKRWQLKKMKEGADNA